MANFFKLIFNELTKIYIRKTTWIMYIILAVLILGFALLNKSFMDEQDLKTYGDDWREVLQEENEQLELEYAEFLKELEAYDEEFARSNADEHGFDQKRFDIEMNGPDFDIIEQNKFYLDEDIKPAGYATWQFVDESSIFLSVVSLLTIIIAAGIVAHEFRWGTIKLLLIRSVSRTKILFSKYVSVLLFALFTLLFVLIIAWLIGAVLFGVESLNAHMLVYRWDIYDEVSGYQRELVPVMKQVFNKYSYGLVNLVMMSTFAFMISAIFRNSSLAIGTAIFLMLTGTSITSVLMAYELSFTKYLLFANTDLKQYTNNNIMMDGMTLGFSITVLIVYYILFLSLAWVFFVKRDVV